VANSQEGVVLQGKELMEKLRVVFDACDTEGHGLISLRELANISRSHVGRGQVDQILDILDPGEETQDKINFEQFYQKFVQFMNNGDKVEEELKMSEQNKYNLNMAPSKVDQGVFNENLRRSFEKNSISTASSPYRSPDRKMLKNSRRKNSQARLSGRIPLVNTSSEDEAEDSFDRKIASSLAMARPMDIQPQFLVRGSSARSTVRKHSNTSNSPTMSTSTRKYSTTSRPSPTSTTRMSPILAPSDGSSFNSPMSSSSTSSDKSDRGSPLPDSGGGCTRLALDELQRKVGQLAETAISQQDDYDSPSSGVGSLRADLEEEISSSLLLARKHGEERLIVERQRHAEQLSSVERERDLERRNFQLRFEQFQEEQDRLRREVEDLKEKVRLVNIEKDHMEEHMAEVIEEHRIRSPVTAVGDRFDEEEQRRRDREEELMITVQRLTERVQTQDQELAEAKEDNIVLKSQVKYLKESRNKENREGSRFRLFGGHKENSPADENMFEDPQNIRVKLKRVEQELKDQKEVNNQLKQYVGEVLVNIMVKNPQILEKN